jgi:mobilome CxxCx(11)CxxC protein
MNTDKNQIIELRKSCWNEALQCFGTSEIFAKRAVKYRRRLRLLTFLGVAVPATVGGILLSFGANFEHLNLTIYLASLLGLVQLVLSLWSLVAKWDDSFAYSLESLSSNRSLVSLFEDIGRNPPSDEQEFKLRYELIQSDNRLRAQRDDQQMITPQEKRYGMRSALRQYRRACAGCNQIPTSMKSTSCGVCGNF